MKILLLFFMLVLPAITRAGDTKIAALVACFEDSSLWSGSSFFPVLDLPATASTTQVFNELLKSGFVRFHTFSVSATETVSMVLEHVPVGTDGKPKWTPVKEPITVVRIQTDAGEKIVFMKHSMQNGWQTTVYDSK